MTRLPGVGIDSYGDLVAATKPNQLSMIHLPGEEGFDPGSIWYGFLLGFPILGLWYWCTDQTIVQRVLGAGTLRDAQHGALFASLLKFLPPLFMVLPGVLAYVLFRDIIDEPTDALPTLITELLPTGLIGIMAAALLAALMSTIAAAVNSTGTLVAVDIARRLPARPVRRRRRCASDASAPSSSWPSPSPGPPRASGSAPSSKRSTSCRRSSSRRPSRRCCSGASSGAEERRQAGTFTLLFGFLAGFVIFLFDMGFGFLGGVQYVSDPVNGLGIPFLLQAWWYFCILSVIYVIVILSTPPPKPRAARRPDVGPGHSPSSPGRRITGIRDPRLLAALLAVALVVMYALVR